MKYVNLRTYTTASDKFGIFNIDAAIQKINDNPEEYSKSFAITEYLNMFSFIDFYKQVKGVDGFNPIFGVELDIASLKNNNIERQEYELFPNLFIAKNESGYQNLCKLQTLFYKSKKKDRIFQEDFFNENKKDLLNDVYILSGGSRGFIFNKFKLYLNEKDENNKKLYLNEINSNILFWKEQTNNNFFIEIQRDGTQYENEFIKFIIPLSIELGVPVVATNNTFFTNKEDYGTHELFMAHKNDYKVSNSHNAPINVTPENYLKSNSEMSELFKDVPVALENSVFISESCDLSFKLKSGKYYLPTIDSPNPSENVNEFFARLSKEGMDEILIGFLDTYCHKSAILPNNDYFRKFQEWIDLDLDLDSMTAPQKLAMIEKTNLYQEYLNRLNYEIDTICEMKFPSYFLVVSDFIKWSKSMDIPIGPGRGSGAGSLVAYALQITALDPLQFNLLFERFLNPERVSMPDFDIDFCSSNRSRVIDYVKRKYNKNNDIYVAQIMNVSTYKLKSSIEMAAKSYGIRINHPMIEGIKKLVEHAIHSENEEAEFDDEVYIDDSDNDVSSQNKFIQQFMNNSSFSLRYQSSIIFRKIIDLASQYYGNMRSVSKHAAGLVISSDPLDKVLPLISIDGNDVTQLNKDNSEALGVIKFDFLALENLTIIRNALTAINKDRKKSELSAITMEDLNKINIYDPNVYESIFQKGNTDNVFQFASTGMKKMLISYKPECFEDLIALVSLYRPGPMDIIPDYIETKHGIKEVQDIAPSCPEVSNILKETYGFIVYQEQVMSIARTYAGYSLGGADLLRRAMGKKDAEEMTRQRDLFVEGCLKRMNSNILSSDEIQNLTNEANKLFDFMESFASYGFNKSHAAAYAMVSFQTAYLKHYYPNEYFLAILNSQVKATSQNKEQKILSSIYDAKNNGVEILPIDLNQSDEVFILNGTKQLVSPFKLIKGFPSETAKKIVSTRKQMINNGYDEERCFYNAIDFSQKMFKADSNITESAFKLLAEAGVFKTLDKEHGINYLIHNAANIISYSKNNNVNIKSNILQNLKMSLIKPAFKQKTTDLKLENISYMNTETPNEEIKYISDRFGFVIQEDKIKRFFNFEKMSAEKIFKDGDFNFQNITSSMKEIKDDLISQIYSASERADNEDKPLSEIVKMIKGNYIINGGLLYFDFSYKNEVKAIQFATEHGIYTTNVHDKNFLEANLDCFQNYYFMVKVGLAENYNFQDENAQPIYKINIQDIYKQENIFEQIVENATLKINDDSKSIEEKKEFILQILDAHKLDEKEAPSRAYTSVDLYGEQIDIVIDDKLKRDFLKNEIYIDLEFKENILNNKNKLETTFLSGNLTKTLSLSDGLVMLKSNKFFKEFNQNAQIIRNLENDSNHLFHKPILLYGYIKDIKTYSNKISGFTLVDEKGVENEIKLKKFFESPTNKYPKIIENQPCFIKVSSYYFDKQDKILHNFHDVYYEDTLKKMNLLHSNYVINTDKIKEFIPLIEKYDANNINDGDKTFIMKYSSKNGEKVFIIDKTSTLKYSPELVEDLKDICDAKPIFNFNLPSITADSLHPVYETNTNYEKTLVSYEYFNSKDNDLYYLNKLFYIDSIKHVKNKLTDLCLSTVYVNESLADLYQNDNKNFMICGFMDSFKVNAKKTNCTIDISDEYGSTSLFLSINKNQSINIDDYKDINEPLFFKVNVHNFPQSNSYAKYVNEIYTIDDMIKILALKVHLKMPLDNYNRLEEIIHEHNSKFNNTLNLHKVPFKIVDLERKSEGDSRTSIMGYVDLSLLKKIEQEFNITNECVRVDYNNNGNKFPVSLFPQRKDNKVEKPRVQYK